MKPGQHRAGLARHLARADGHHHDPAWASPRFPQVEAQGSPGTREVGAPLLEQHLTPAQNLARARSGGAQRQVDDPDGLQAREPLALNIQVWKADVQEPVFRPGGFAGPGGGPRPRDGVAFPPASGEGENPAG